MPSNELKKHGGKPESRVIQEKSHPVDKTNATITHQSRDVPVGRKVIDPTVTIDMQIHTRMKAIGPDQVREHLLMVAVGEDIMDLISYIPFFFYTVVVKRRCIGYKPCMIW